MSLMPEYANALGAAGDRLARRRVIARRRVRLMALVALTPEIFVALPSTTGCTPARTSMKGVDGDCSLGLALRLNAATNRIQHLTDTKFFTVLGEPRVHRRDTEERATHAVLAFQQARLADAELRRHVHHVAVAETRHRATVNSSRDPIRRASINKIARLPI